MHCVHKNISLVVHGKTQKTTEIYMRNAPLKITLLSIGVVRRTLIKTKDIILSLSTP